MCYAQEGYVQPSDSVSLGLEQLETVFYSLVAIELIGFAIGIGENVVKQFLCRKTRKMWNILQPLSGENIPFYARDVLLH